MDFMLKVVQSAEHLTVNQEVVGSYPIFQPKHIAVEIEDSKGKSDNFWYNKAQSVNVFLVP